MSTETSGSLRAKLEALLFIYGEPMALSRIVKTLGIDEEAARRLLEELKDALAADERGLMLVSANDKFQLATKAEFKSILEDFIKQELAEELTPASVETLALIAYFGPISRRRLEYVRGVNSSFILRNLLVRGLIERLQNPEEHQGFLYGPSAEFLKHVGLAAREELPNYGEFRSLLEKFEGSFGPNE